MNESDETKQEGGEKKKEGGVWWFMSGEPTKALTVDEYRDWVLDRIAARMLKIIGAIVSAVGLAGFAALYLLAKGQIDEQGKQQLAVATNLLKSEIEQFTKTSRPLVQATIETELTKFLFVNTDLKMQLVATASNDLTRSITRFSEAQIQTNTTIISNTAHSVMTAELEPKRMVQLIRDNLNDPSVGDDLRRIALRYLTESNEFIKIIARQVLPAIRGENDDTEDQRIQAIYMARIFGGLTEREQLRQVLFGIAMRPEESRRIRAEALRACPISSNLESNRAMLDYLLRQLAETAQTPRRVELPDALDENDLSTASLPPPLFNDNGVERGAYIQLMAALPQELAVAIKDWIVTNQNENARQTAVQALVSMRGNQPVEYLVSLSSHENDSVRRLALLGLRNLSPNRPMDRSTRLQAAQMLWERIAADIRGPGSAEVNLVELKDYVSKLNVASTNVDWTELNLLLQRQDSPPGFLRWNESLSSGVRRKDRQAVLRIIGYYNESSFLSSILAEQDIHSRYRSEYSVVANLLRAEDWGELFSRRFWPDDAGTTKPGRALAEGLLLVWSERLGKGDIDGPSLTNACNGLLHQALKQPNCIYRRALVSVFQFCGRYCDPAAAKEAQRQFLKLYLDAPDESSYPAFGVNGFFRAAARFETDTNAVTYLEAARSVITALTNETRMDRILEGVHWYYSQNVADTGQSLVALANWSTQGTSRAHIELRGTVADLMSSKASQLLSASLYSRTPDYTPVIALLSQRISLAPTQAAYNVRGLAECLAGQFAAATNDFLKAAATEKDSKKRAGYLENIGVVLLWQEQWAEALKFTDRVRREEERASWNWYVRLIAAQKLDNADIVKESKAKLKAYNIDSSDLVSYLPPSLRRYLTGDLASQFMLK